MAEQKNMMDTGGRSFNDCGFLLTKNNFTP